MEIILSIVSILLFLILLLLIMTGVRKHNSLSKEDAKQLRSENEALRKELRKHGIVEYV